MRLRATLPAPPARVHEALTDPAEQRKWLADETSEAGFWGPHVPQGDGPHQELVASSPTLVRFHWRLDDQQTTVDIALEPVAEGTALTLTHEPLPTLAELMSPPGRRDGRHTMHTFWPLAIGNLSQYLAGRELIDGTDFTRDRSPAITVTLTITAPAAAVWASITDPAEVERWWGYAPEIEPRLGGKVTFGGEGEISEWAPNHVFAYTEEDMTTRWELSESDGTTTLTFVQSGFTAPDDAAQHEAGWRGGLLELKRMHELGADWSPASRELED
jgi:uncharacterized protein YndB with AHSA1/START domain